MNTLFAERICAGMGAAGGFGGFCADENGAAIRTTNEVSKMSPVRVTLDIASPGHCSKCVCRFQPALEQIVVRGAKMEGKDS
jgi:hypothetical protein